METHFGPSEEPITEQTEIGLYYADGVIDPNSIKNAGSKIFVMGSTRMKLEPHDPHYELSDTYEFTEDAVVTHFKFHMHFRGKSCKIVFHYPDGTQETAIDVPKFQFDWQQVYFLSEPMSVPKGTVAEFFGVWDNSAHFRRTRPDAVSLPEVFKQHGYFTQGVGKIYHGGSPSFVTPILDPQSWSVPHQPPDYDFNTGSS